MKPARALRLRKESLSELTTYDLLSVAGGTADRLLTCYDCTGDIRRLLATLVQTGGGTGVDCTTTGYVEIAVTR